MIYLIFLVSAILAFIAQKKNSRFFAGLLVIVLSLFVGLRSANVGVDTEMYYAIFQRLQRGVFSPNIEKEFLWFCYVLLKIMDTEHLLLLFSFATNALIIARLWSLRDKESFLMMSLLYILFFYCETANIFRQYMAIAIVFYATAFLEKQKPIAFFALLMSAMVFHRSAMLGAAYYPLYYLIRNNRLEKHLEIELAGAVVLAAAAMLILTYRGGRYLDIYSSGKLRIGLLYPAKFFLVCVYLFANIRKFKECKYDKEFIFTRLISAFYLLGIVLSSAGYYEDSLYRIGLYYIIYETVFIPHVCRKGINRYLFSASYLLLVSFVAYNFYLAGWSGLANYSTWIF